MRYLHILAAAVLAFPGSAVAQQAAAGPPPGCRTPEYRTLDFWVGEWVAEWVQNGEKGTGTNRITRDEYGDCVITEHFRSDDGSLIGHSVSTYRPGMKQCARHGSTTKTDISTLSGARSPEPTMPSLSRTSGFQSGSPSSG